MSRAIPDCSTRGRLPPGFVPGFHPPPFFISPLFSQASASCFSEAEVELFVCHNTFPFASTSRAHPPNLEYELAPGLAEMQRAPLPLGEKEPISCLRESRERGKSWWRLTFSMHSAIPLCLDVVQSTPTPLRIPGLRGLMRCSPQGFSFPFSFLGCALK